MPKSPKLKRQTVGKSRAATILLALILVAVLLIGAAGYYFLV